MVLFVETSRYTPFSGQKISVFFRIELEGVELHAQSASARPEWIF